MKQLNFTVIVVGAIAFLSACSQKKEKELENLEEWRSDDGKFGVVVAKATACESEYEVRAIIAGVMDGIFNDPSLLYPEKLVRTKLANLPGFQLLGTSYAHGLIRNYSLLVAFGSDGTYTVASFSPVGGELPNILDHFNIQDSPLDQATVGIDYVYNNLIKEFVKFQTLSAENIKLKTGHQVEQGGSGNPDKPDPRP